MNERIRELARESGLVQYDTDSKMLDAERFAELIVRECISRVEGCAVENPNDDEFVKGYNKGVSKVTSQVKAHFGVDQ